MPDARACWHQVVRRLWCDDSTECINHWGPPLRPLQTKIQALKLPRYSLRSKQTHCQVPDSSRKNEALFILLNTLASPQIHSCEEKEQVHSNAVKIKQWQHTALYKDQKHEHTYTTLHIVFAAIWRLRSFPSCSQTYVNSLMCSENKEKVTQCTKTTSMNYEWHGQLCFRSFCS